MVKTDRGIFAIIIGLGLIILIAAVQIFGSGSSIAAPADPLPEDLGVDVGVEYSVPAKTSPATPAPRASQPSPVSSAARTATNGGGGIVLRPDPRIDDIRCVKECVSPRRATPGATVRITGNYLESVRRVIFPGKTKRLRVRWKARKTNAIRVVVPRGADDGRPFVVNGSGVRSNRAPRDLLIVARTRIPKEVFPVRGPYSYGSSGSSFGAGRPGHIHQGQDLSAACGTKLVAIKASTVVYNDYDSGAGNYVVLKNEGENTYFAYMHMVRPSTDRVGKKLQAGEPIGRVGNTGASSGCHLHFEYWVGPWQTGGKPIDPLPYLRSL